jgi:hypothetical protein
MEKLEGFPEDKLMQVYDYVAFLESTYNLSVRTRSPIEKLVAGVQDSMRAARVPAAAFRGTMSAVDAAGRMMRGLAAAGRVVAEEIDTGTRKPDGELPGATTESAGTGS